MTDLENIFDLSYEQAFAELEQVVEALEAGDLPLEKALDEFQRGQALAARCSQLLEEAELKLRRMIDEETKSASKTQVPSEDT
jgi:exodeoxyribonuclease VII small subunit